MVDLTPADTDVDGDALLREMQPVDTLRQTLAGFGDAEKPRDMVKPDYMPAIDQDDRSTGGAQQSRHHFTRSQILAHAVRLAHLNGWRILPNQYRISSTYYDEQDGYSLRIAWNQGHQPGDAEDPSRWLPKEIAAERILCDKSFAQAIWGQAENYGVPSWQHHLQQLILSDDRLLYLGQHLYDDVP
jgi:hypothetical protein